MRNWIVHFARWGMLVVIVLAIRERHREFLVAEANRKEITASASQIALLLSKAAIVEPAGAADGGAIVRDANGAVIGFVVQTAPRANKVVGYSGPNNVLLAFDDERRLVGALLIRSGDTKDHAKLVRADAEFWRSFEGRTWEELSRLREFDGVSGATLTSAAIVEGIVVRLNGDPPNLRFPAEMSVDDAKVFFSDAVKIERDEATTAWKVANDAGETIGYVMRTSPHSDRRIGYQGPTDGLLAIDAAGTKVVGIGIKASYETEQYVEDTTLDWTFMHRFDEMPLAEFSALSVGVGEDIEGVSGATMTSQTLIENLRDAAARFLRGSEETRDGQEAKAEVSFQAVWSRVRIQGRDVGTIAVVLMAGVMAFTNLRGKTWLRRAWQVVLIGYLGFVNADLVSQALLVGWSQNGVAWEFAAGLVVLTAAAFLVPFGTKTQLYCHQLCPHGAAQELLRNRFPWRVRISKRWDQVLGVVPGILLILVLAVALWRWPVDLAEIEPFDAYAVRAASWATITIAVGGLIASLFVPMAYCRYGCPTGALLSYVRRNARSGEFSRQDALAGVLTVAAAVVAWG